MGSFLDELFLSSPPASILRMIWARLRGKTDVAFTILACVLLWIVVVEFGHADESLDRGLAKAQALIGRGDLKAAEAELLSLSKTFPRSFVVHNDLGTLLMQQGRYQEACPRFERAVALNSKLADLQRNWGACLFQIDEPSQALRPLKVAKSLDPNDVRTRYLLGYSLLLLDQLKEAEPELEFVRSRMPGEERTLFALVKLYQRKGEEARAGAAFSELQREHPDSVYVHILLGESYDLQERREDAIAEFKKAVSMASDMPRLHFDLGFLLWAGNQLTEAEHAFRSELRLNPRFAPALFYLGDIELNKENHTEALRLMREAIAASPNCMEAYIGLGRTYFRMSKMREAAEQFERANLIQPDQPDVQYWLGTAYRRMGQPERSAQFFKRFQQLTGKETSESLSTKASHDRWMRCLSQSH